MEVLEILGYISALIIGISLGLIGGGGSILAVPVLAYLFGIDEKAATAYSLFIVGASALIGGLQANAKKLVDWEKAFLFGIPAMVGVSIVRKFLVPILPNVLFTISDFDFTRRMAMFGLFAVLMIPAAFSMLKPDCVDCPKREKIPYFTILLEGLAVGSITGLIGAGGGFLIIPALVLLANVDFKIAVGTSLIIIAFKSLAGFFLGDALSMEIDWAFLAAFSGLSFAGIFIGSYLGKFINGKKLKRSFGYFIFVMAAFIFYMEFVL